jgi:hypothetical protein
MPRNVVRRAFGDKRLGGSAPALHSISRENRLHSTTRCSRRLRFGFLR